MVCTACWGLIGKNLAEGPRRVCSGLHREQLPRVHHSFSPSAFPLFFTPAQITCPHPFMGRNLCIRIQRWCYSAAQEWAAYWRGDQQSTVTVIQVARSVLHSFPLLSFAFTAERKASSSHSEGQGQVCLAHTHQTSRVQPLTTRLPPQPKSLWTTVMTDQQVSGGTQTSSAREEEREEERAESPWRGWVKTSISV